ncbi:hypothetical protein [Caulobacter sp. NIBR1757]|uniref:hypothetical protein n=1 Tax=Caulobacter sp. NIBR1757 TaxID=3016000 RepID=UPI0022EFFF98|nr:hypothetical protein [Caulobacter sp. NIBR1757]WGM40659.1 hypothetical protein AMEJIAPC_03606 [Caulobacter sp. NIBR1757]
MNPDIDITVYVEALLADVGPWNQPRKLLGRILNVELTSLQAGETTGDHAGRLTPLLSPWLWDVTWDNTRPDAGAGVAAPIGLADAITSVLADILKEDRQDLLKAPPADADQSDPYWLAILAQLGRLHPLVSQGLKLTDVRECEDMSQEDLIIRTIKIGADSYTIGQRHENGVRFRCVAQPEVWNRAALSNQLIGLIEPLGRLVKSVDDGSLANWLADLPGRLGAALNPAPRLADLAEAEAVTVAAAANHLKVGLERLLAPLGDATILAPLLSQDGAPPDMQMADRWAADLAGRLPRIRDEILAALTKDQGADGPMDPSELRLRYASASAVEPLSQGLAETLPTAMTPAQKVIRAAAESWLRQISNISPILHGLLPDRLARDQLLPALVAAVANNAVDDWTELQTQFGVIFPDAARAVLGLRPGDFPGAFEAMAAALKSDLFGGRQDVDQGAQEGLAVRVDSVFHKPPAGLPDLHTQLDGFLMAVQPTWIADGLLHEGDWALVTRGRSTLSAGAARIDLQDGPTPLPVAFEMSWQSGGAAESRHALANYHGRPLIPLTSADKPPPVSGPDQEVEVPPTPALTLDYLADGGPYPDLAYGRDYRVAIGYQAPGGILPRGFCAPADPFTYAPDAQILGDTDWRRDIRFRRSLKPGAPRLLPAGETDSPLQLGGPRDHAVPPLWREYAALWTGADAAAQRRRLDGLATLFLDPVGADKMMSLTPAQLAFDIRPPALALGDSRPDTVQNAAVWRYWTARDSDFTGAAPATAPAVSDMDDPAVVGGPGGAATGRGGVIVRLSEITPTGLVSKASQPIVLTSGAAVRVVVETGQGHPDLTMTVAGRTVTINSPPATRFVVEALTACDPAFFAGGDDVRFAADTPVVTEHGLVVFGRSALVFEALPLEAHLPSADDLWRALDLTQTGVALAARPSPSAFDYIGSIEATHQRWTWDGGPVWPLSDFGGLSFGLAEPPGAGRDGRFVAFETTMMGRRGSAGITTTARATAGHKAQLLTLEQRPNQGGDYLRIRAEAISRYAPLRQGAGADPGLLRIVAQLGDTDLGRWRGVTLALSRRDPLPTPRLALAAPTFGRVGGGAGMAGGIGLYLDQPMFDTRDGAGLAELLEVEVLAERLITPATTAHSIGPDPILTGDADPWMTGVEPSTWVLSRGVILGQTLEPFSASPRIPFSIALLDPIIGQQEVKPDTMARIRARTTFASPMPGVTPAEQERLTSPWSAPVWVHFLPDVAAVIDEQVLFQCRQQGGRVTLSGNAIDRILHPVAAEAAAARLARLTDRVTDLTPSGAPHLAQGLWAIALATVRDVTGDEVIRASQVVRAQIIDGAIRFDLDDDITPAYVRLLEVQTVRTTEAPDADLPTSLLDATERWFGAAPDPEVGSGRAAPDPDVLERIVAVGPLVKVEAA